MDKANTVFNDILTIIVRLIGLIVLIVGLYIGLKVIFEAWHLYEQPQRIERFATAIEQGSHVDALLATIASKTPPESTEQDHTPPAIQTAEQPQLRLTYFIAWGIAVLLLMVVGGLATAAIRTGGQLALYDLQVKQLAKQLHKQAKKTQQEEYREYPKE